MSISYKVSFPPISQSPTPPISLSTVQVKTKQKLLQLRLKETLLTLHYNGGHIISTVNITPQKPVFIL